MPNKKTPRHAIDISEEDGVRYLHFGSDWVQGAMRIARPWSLELAYTREMMAGLLLRQESAWPRSALLIGLGAGSLAKFIYRNLPDCRSTVVEINPQVELIASQYFKLPDDPLRLAVFIGDGADFMLTGQRRYDYILVDGFDPDARAGALDTPPFYQACRARLSDQGLLCVNLLGRSKGFAASVARLETAFDGRIAIFPSCDSGNRRYIYRNHDRRNADPRAVPQKGDASRPVADDRPPAARLSAPRWHVQALIGLLRSTLFFRQF